jgi:hypothetical protein
MARMSRFWKTGPRLSCSSDDGNRNEALRSCQSLESFVDGGDRRLRVGEQGGFAADRIREKRVQGHRVPAGAA